MKPKKEAWRWLFLAILFLFLDGLVWSVIQFHRNYEHLSSDLLIGNKMATVKALKEKGFPFSFLVIGDTQSSRRAQSLIEMAVKGTPPSFMVILGDFVPRPDIWYHHLFLTEMAVEINPPFPVFLVAGNHDIDYGSKIVARERSVTPEIYESFYGPRNFDFVYNNCLFIICGVDLNNSAAYLEYLHDTLSKKREGKKHVFVFVHYPPKGLVDYIEGYLPREEEFLSLLEAYRVTSCFFGDFHGYWRGQRRGVNLIVSGGGGRHKPSQSEWGKFHHILRISVNENQVSEEIITAGKGNAFQDFFREMVFTKFFPMMKNRGWIPYLLLILFSGSCAYAFIFFCISIKKEQKTP